MATLFNGFSSGRGFNAPRDLAGVERIEFLKGTAAALYGSSEPGGTLNVVSKRPLWRSEEHTSELQSLTNLVCRLLLEKKKKNTGEIQYRRKAPVVYSKSRAILGDRLSKRMCL